MARRAIPTERLAGVSSSDRGLTGAEAAARLARYGPNHVTETRRHPLRELIEDTVRDPMIWFFAFTAALYAWIGETVEAVTLAAAIVPLIGIDVFLHRRTQSSTAGLRSRIAARVRVLRDGTVQEIPAAGVVPGDLILLQAGDSVPADGVLLAAGELQAEESVLTGEAFPVRKRTVESLGGQAAEESWLFAGTRILAGEARLLALHTGADTLYGEIVRSAEAGSHERTPLQRSIARLVGILLMGAILLCAALAVVRLQQGHGWVDAVINAVVLATAAIPEEFPVLFTFYLGLGVFRLARKHALVRRAVTVENIGRVTVICSDKTGTLTEGRLVLAHIHPRHGVAQEHLLRMAALASRGDTGDPLDAAILAAARVRGLPVNGHERLATFPFTEDRKRETALVRGPDGRRFFAMKGAAEVLAAMSAIPDAERDLWLAETGRFAAEAHKVIAVASLEAEGGESAEPASGLQFEGLLAFEDPVRPGVPEAVQECEASGIRVVMVTGDHAGTARAVASEIGLGDGGPLVAQGPELESLGAGELARLGILARAKPAEKLALVRKLRAAGEIVAVTGDGVNDVPALQAADIGIAMGGRGTQPAREAASIVLLDDNFASLVAAISEGRQLFQNLRTSFLYVILVHAPLVVTAAAIPLLGFPPLYLPVHVIWLEVLLHPTAMLVFQDLPGGRLGRVSRGHNPRFYSNREWFTLALVGALATALVTAGFLFSEHDAGTPHGRAMALALLTSWSAGITAALSGLRTRAARIICAVTLATAALFIQTPALAAFLKLSPLHAGDWAVAGVCVAALSALLALLRRSFW